MGWSTHVDGDEAHGRGARSQVLLEDVLDRPAPLHQRSSVDQDGPAGVVCDQRTGDWMCTILWGFRERIVFSGPLKKLKFEKKKKNLVGNEE
jgi:hypothetical protein